MASILFPRPLYGTSTRYLHPSSSAPAVPFRREPSRSAALQYAAVPGPHRPCSASCSAAAPAGAPPDAAKTAEGAAPGAAPAVAAPTAAELLADEFAGKKIVKDKGAKNIVTGVANI